MKKFKLSVFALMMALIFCLTPSLAAEAAEGAPGSKVTVTFPFSKIQSVDARINYSNRNLFSNVTVNQSLGMSGSATEAAVCYSGDGSNKSGSVKVTVTIDKNAKVGDKCTIALDELYVTDSSGNYVGLASKTEVVTVVAAQPASSSTKPKVDTSKLEEQIKLAEALKNEGYTADSWNALLEALANGRDALVNGDQKTVDAATEALIAAMKGLVKMDYSKLQAAINDGNALIDSDENAQLWYQLLQALIDGTALLTSDDQATVDAAADEINALIEAVKKLLAEQAADEVVAPVTPAEPEGEYCNIPMHKVWPILFFISLIANVVLVVLLVVVNKNKKKTKDDTPLVDYEIGDDE